MIKTLLGYVKQYKRDTLLYPAVFCTGSIYGSADSLYHSGDHR